LRRLSRHTRQPVHCTRIIGRCLPSKKFYGGMIHVRYIQKDSSEDPFPEEPPPLLDIDVLWHSKKLIREPDLLESDAKGNYPTLAALVVL
jgi:hypothetical protein